MKESCYNCRPEKCQCESAAQQSLTTVLNVTPDEGCARWERRGFGWVCVGPGVIGKHFPSDLTYRPVEGDADPLHICTSVDKERLESNWKSMNRPKGDRE